MERPVDSTTGTTPSLAAALVGWRLLALLYDLFPVAGLWFVVAAVFVAVNGDAVTGGALGMVEFTVLWLVTGGYAVASWRRGGQTLGMRPWRLRVVDKDGGSAHARARVVNNSSASRRYIQCTRRSG